MLEEARIGASLVYIARKWRENRKKGSTAVLSISVYIYARLIEISTDTLNFQLLYDYIC